MGLFDKLKKQDNVAIQSAGVTVSTINLEKSTISLEKTLIDLTKRSGVSFNEHRAKVGLVLDYSGSMRNLYKDGTVQETLTRLMPLALKFDDNGELDVWLFHEGFYRLESMDINSYSDYVHSVIDKGNYRMGTTSYAPVLSDVMKKYFVEDKKTSNIPTFLIFVTDGNNDDKRETDRLIRESAEKNIFIQFVGIGHERFEYLQKLDDLSGRRVDNTGFFKVENLKKLSDDELYNMLLDQYPEWLTAVGL